MTIVKGFDIDTVSGSEAYLESEKVSLEDKISRLKLSAALDLAEKNGELPEGYCKDCRTAPCKRAGISPYPEDDE